MSTWRKKAFEAIPELQKEFKDADFEIYSVFSVLLSILQESCLANDVGKIRKNYAYAEWCFRQREPKLWNAAGVAFYEHLGDTNETFLSIRSYLSKEIYIDIRGLLEIRIDKSKLSTLDKFYQWKE